MVFILIVSRMLMLVGVQALFFGLRLALPIKEINDFVC